MVINRTGTQFPSPTGYQQAILHLLGVYTDGKFCVRCIDRWYIDAVSDLFPTRPYLQHHNASGKKDYWVLKSAKVDYRQDLSQITDWQGFCRGVIELQGGVDRWPHHTRKGVRISTLRLRIYGASDLLELVMAHIPAAPKKIQSVKTNNGVTHSIHFQSPSEVSEILSYIHGDPFNARVLEKWESAFIPTDAT